MSVVKIDYGFKSLEKVMVITLNSPETRNALSLEVIDQLCNALEMAKRDSNVFSVIIKGDQKAFSSGGNVKDMKERKGIFSGDSNELRENYLYGIQRIPRTIEHFHKPIIAVVEGAAFGAGCDLSMMCDFRIATENAKFCEAFGRIGLIPGIGGSFFLQRIVGYHKALELTMTGEVISGKQAKDLGIVTVLSSEENIENDVESFLKRIHSSSPVALELTKKAMKAAMFQPLEHHLDMLASFQGIAQRTEDHFEGVDALLEKRSPEFKGQ